MVSLPQFFVINLARHSDRREFMAAQLRLVGINGEFIDAIDGRALSAEELASHQDPQKSQQKWHRTLSPGEVGCSLSHQKIYRCILERGLPWAVILEDDALLGKDFISVLRRLIESLDAAQPVACLFTHVDKYTGWGRQRLDRKHWLVRPVRAFNAHCYLVTAGAARVLLEANYPIHTPVDYWTYFGQRPGIKIRAVVPYCVGWAPSAASSAIEPERKAHQASSVKPLSTRIRNAVVRTLYWKFLYQLGIKQLLRVKKQRIVW